MYAPYGSFFAIVPKLRPKNVAGAAMAPINRRGALRSVVGSSAVGGLNGTIGSPAASYAFMSAAFVAAVGLTLAVKPHADGAPAVFLSLHGKLST